MPFPRIGKGNKFGNEQAIDMNSPGMNCPSAPLGRMFHRHHVQVNLWQIFKVEHTKSLDVRYKMIPKDWMCEY